MRADKASILLLDDNADLADLYRERIESLGPFRVVCATEGQIARAMAERSLFDVVVIDAKLYYRGLEFGGLRLADDLRARYGRDAILVISRYVTGDLIREYGADLSFLSKEVQGSSAFVELLSKKLADMCARQYAFVAMPYDEGLRSLYWTQVKSGIESTGLRCVRADEVVHNRRVPEVVLELIENSKLVVLVADGTSPNAYYEAGYADALRKEVVVVARTLDELAFDVSQRSTVVYGDRVESLGRQLAAKVLRMRHPDELGDSWGRD